jgi:glycosyl transferase family 87
MAALTQERVTDLWATALRLPGLRVLQNDRFSVGIFGVLALVSAVRNLPSPAWFSVELDNYAWALNRLMTHQHIYSVPLPNNPLNPGAHYTPPPFTPLLGGQFANTPILWGIINLSAIVAGMLFAAAASGAISGRQPLRAIAVAVVAAVAFGPTVTVLLLGNQQGFVVLALGATWWLERRRRSALSGIALAASWLLKLFPGLLFVRTIGREQWRALLAGLATSIVVIGVSAVVLGPHRYINFLRNMLERAQPAFDQDFNVAPATMFDSIPITAIIVIAGILLIVRSAHRDEPAVSFARAIIISLVVWPVSWYQYASIALVASAATLDRRTWRWLALSLILFSIANPLTWIAGGVVGWIGMGRFREARVDAQAPVVDEAATAPALAGASVPA